MISLWFYCVN